MTRKTVLITGATGATGGYAIDALLSLPVSIRALVRSDDDRAAALRAKGLETVVGDLLDIDTLRAAMQDVSSAYFVYPLLPGLVTAAAYFAQAATEAGVEAIVNMSQISARPDSASHQARDHWISERLFDHWGVPVTHIRPTFFAEWLTRGRQVVTIAEENLFRLPFGTGRHAPIAAADQGRFIAAILADPAPHAGKTYPLCGPVEMDYHGVAAALSEELGRTIVYAPIAVSDYRRQLEARSMPEQMIQHLCAVAEDYQAGLFRGVDRIIKAVTGIPPMTVQAFAEAHRAELCG
ncbi:NmrA family NAD(P)-binding protein [soil metagenome]